MAIQGPYEKEPIGVSHVFASSGWSIRDVDHPGDCGKNEWQAWKFPKRIPSRLRIQSHHDANKSMQETHYVRSKVCLLFLLIWRQTYLTRNNSMCMQRSLRVIGVLIRKARMLNLRSKAGFSSVGAYSVLIPVSFIE